MNITNLEITNFRKFKKFKLSDLKLINIIIGKNGVGKTSIIESIYYGSISKSFKSYYDDVLFKENESFFKIKIDLNDNNRQKKLELVLDGKEKRAKIDNQIIKKLSDYICQYSVVLFSPDDIRLIKDSPNIRRNYLNIQISNLSREYITLINNYNKCNVYEVSTNNDSFNIDNGILVVTKDDNILKISDISYKGLVKDAIYVQIGLYVKVDGKDSLINSFSATSSEGFNINEYLSKIKFDINENNDNTDVFTNKVKSNIEDSLYLRVSMTSTDNINFNEDIKVRVKSLYRNTKLFY